MLWSIVACSIFVFALFAFIRFSCLYHGLHKNTGKKVLRVMDHDMVFVLIMGTYAPYSLISLREYSGLVLGHLWLLHSFRYHRHRP
jgi:hemolysin III